MQTLLQNYSEIASKLGPEIAPKWVPKGSKMAPWRPPGGLGGPWGTPGGPRHIFERFWGSFGVRFGVPKSSQNLLKMKLKSKVALNANFWASGGLLGRFLGPFWDDFGVLFGCPRREAGICEKSHGVQARARKIEVPGVENQQKQGPKTASSSNWAARAVWEAPGVDL